VKAVSNFVIFVLQESGRAVREYHKILDGLRRENDHRGPRVRGQKPRTPSRLITPARNEGPRGKRIKRNA
jgi:hypothetical protein